MKIRSIFSINPRIKKLIFLTALIAGCILFGLQLNGWETFNVSSVIQQKTQIYSTDKLLAQLGITKTPATQFSLLSWLHGSQSIDEPLFTIPLKNVKAYTGKFKGGDDLDCGSIEFNDSGSTIEYTKPVNIGAPPNPEQLRKYVEKFSAKTPQLDIDNMKPDRWFQFSGSAIWLQDQKCYLQASRVMYAPDSRSTPSLSLIWLQVFDANWKELDQKRLRFLNISEDKVQHIVEEIKKVGQTSKKAENLLDKISIKFPTVMDVSFAKFKTNRCIGPSDARISIHTTKEGITEPVVFYDSLDEKENRGYFVAFPLRSAEGNSANLTPSKEFHGVGGGKFEVKSVEKNWMPFPGDPSNYTHMDFIYQVEPLAVVRCNLEDGSCTPKFFDKNEGAEVDKVSLRGGTNLVSVPENNMKQIRKLSGFKGHDIQCWVAFAKLHGWDCGCGMSTYRPTLMLLTRVDDNYRIDLMTEGIDFDIDVLSFDGRTTKCSDGLNVLTPNSIPFWKVGKYKDWMEMTISEADANIKIMRLKNMMQYINHILNDLQRQKQSTNGISLSRRNAAVQICMKQKFLGYCKNYGENHP